jgi:hypothetical protein
MLRQTNERELLMALHSQISALWHAVEDLKATQQQHRLDGRHEFQALQANLHQIAVQPDVRSAADEPNGGAAGGIVGTLSLNLRICSICFGGNTSMVLGEAKQHGFLLARRRGGESSTSIIKERLSGIA